MIVGRTTKKQYCRSTTLTAPDEAPGSHSYESWTRWECCKYGNAPPQMDLIDPAFRAGFTRFGSIGSQSGSNLDRAPPNLINRTCSTRCTLPIPSFSCWPNAEISHNAYTRWHLLAKYETQPQNSELQVNWF